MYNICVIQTCSSKRKLARLVNFDYLYKKNFYISALGEPYLEKRYAVLVVIAIVLVGSLAATFYYNSGNTPTQMQSPSLTITPTSTITPDSTSTPTSTIVPSPNPMASLIDQVRDSITTFSLNDPYGNGGVSFVHGKVLVWDMAANEEFVGVESLLTPESQAKSSGENMTIFALTDVGAWVHAVAIYWPEKVFAGSYDIPIDYSRENATIRIPAEWINGLPRIDSVCRILLSTMLEV